MNLKNFLLYMIFATLLCWFGFFMIIQSINPNEAGVLAFLLFYLILGLSIMGTLTILGFLFRKLFYKDRLAFDHVIVSFRQAILLSLVIVISLYLQAHGLLTWWNAVLLILALSLLELFYLNYYSNKK